MKYDFSFEAKMKAYVKNEVIPPSGLVYTNKNNNKNKNNKMPSNNNKICEADDAIMVSFDS